MNVFDFEPDRSGSRPGQRGQEQQLPTRGYFGKGETVVTRCYSDRFAHLRPG